MGECSRLYIILRFSSLIHLLTDPLENTTMMHRAYVPLLELFVGENGVDPDWSDTRVVARIKSRTSFP
jgi:hypothetical protein